MKAVLECVGISTLVIAAVASVMGLHLIGIGLGVAGAVFCWLAER